MRFVPPLPQRLDPLVAAMKRIGAADPFLMAAAIAYNAIFALVPLAFAAVAAISMLGSGSDRFEQAEQRILTEFPPDVARFLISILGEAQDTVGGMGPVFLIVSLLIALWSGSRAVYAVQKALRLVEGIEEDRSYLVKRGLGILFTLGAGFALMVSSVAVIFGNWLVETLDQHGIPVGSTWVTGAVLVLWVAAVLYAVYRWGTPVPLRMSFGSAVVGAATLAVSAWLAAILIPTFGSSSLSALGTTGVILLWSYGIGLIVISVPVFVPAFFDMLRGSSP
jgi:membrane protein